MKEVNIQKLRGIVRNSLERHHYESAVFWGDKVVTLSGGDAEDVYWLVQAYIQTHQYHRACLLVNNYNLIGNGSLCYLSALSHFKVQEYQESLTLLEGTAGWGGPTTLPIPALDNVIALECSRQLLRAKVYEALDNAGQASECYQAALLADPLCYDALKALTDHHMLTGKEERDLVESLPLDVRCDTQFQKDLVRVCYQTKINKCAVNELDDNTETKTDNSPTLPEVKPTNIINLDNIPSSVAILSNNLDILTARAERLYYKCSFVSCFEITKKVLEQDPYHTECLPVHIACLIELQQPNTLFLLAHKLVDLYPETALAWFAVGSYYYLIGKNEHARRYLSKATTIDKVFGPAWIAYAHSFAAENEHDQASAAYFKASQLMKGSHLPLLYIGMEYSLANNPKFAETFFQKAVEMAPEDPFVLHELGVVKFTNQQYELSESYLRRAVAVVDGLYGEKSHCFNVPAKWATLLNNLAHTLRKRGKWRESLKFHYQAVRLQPNDACTFTAIALCLALLGELEEAVEVLHNSLSIQREQPVATTMLASLMEQMVASVEPFSGDEEDVELPIYTNILDCIAANTKDPSVTPLLTVRVPDTGAVDDDEGAIDAVMGHGGAGVNVHLSPPDSVPGELDALPLPGSSTDTTLPHHSTVDAVEDTSTDMLESSSVLSVSAADSPSAPQLDATNRSVMSLEDMVMDEDSD